MNKKKVRIIIIGNGFDLAHGLPTRYGDFLTDLKDSIVKVEGSGLSLSFKRNGSESEEHSGYYHRLNENNIEDEWIGVKIVEKEVKLAVNPHNESIYFKSLFSAHDKLGNWSDLESHYFETLYKHRDSRKNIELINSEFEHIKILLFDYLKSKVEDGKKYEIHATSEIYKMLKLNHNDFEFDKNYFVTFNYTSRILNQYFFWLRDSDKDKFSHNPIHIHGHLTTPSNPIIFGYGDENSKEYEELELLKNNDLLMNFKTFQYLRSNRYTQILGLLEQSEDIYIQIIGHSCGLCDKALLRKIFQHDNVKYIESTYHLEESNYFENLYNISRIFDDNTLMRERIIPLEETFKIE